MVYDIFTFDAQDGAALVVAGLVTGSDSEYSLVFDSQRRNLNRREPIVVGDVVAGVVVDAMVVAIPLDRR